VPFGYAREQEGIKVDMFAGKPAPAERQQFSCPGPEIPFKSHTHGVYTIGVKRENSRAAGKLVTEYTVSLVTYGGDLDSTRVAKPEVHAEVR